MRKILITLLLLMSVLVILPQAAFAAGEPTVTITLDKESVEVGETVTAEYEIDCQNYESIWYYWNLVTNEEEYQSPDDAHGDIESLKGSFCYTPKFGERIECVIGVEDKNGRLYFFHSEEIPVIGDNSIAPRVSIVLDKESVSVGETVTAEYEIDCQNYESIWCYWNLVTNEEEYQSPDDAHGDIESLKGSFCYTPKFGERIECVIGVEDKNGRLYFFYSEEIPISGFAADYDIYSVIEGQNTQISTGETSLTFRADGEFEKYLGVQVDGKTVPSKHVKAWSGSTYVELSAEYLASLPEGDHELVIVFEDGVAVTQFATAKQMAELPQTGDSSNMALYMMLTVFSAVSLMGMAKKRRIG